MSTAFNAFNIQGYNNPKYHHWGNLVCTGRHRRQLLLDATSNPANRALHFLKAIQRESSTDQSCSVLLLSEVLVMQLASSSASEVAIWA